MDRTLSAAQRGSFAIWSATKSAARAVLSFASFRKSLSATRIDRRAGPALVAGAAACCGLALALPSMDSATVTSALFALSAALAALVLLVPSAPVSSAHLVSSPDLIQQSVPMVRRPRATLAELYEAPDHAMPDRAHWARLTSHMSHELRTPLNAVLGFSEMMSNEVFGPLGATCYGDYARDIHASGRVLLKSAEDALAITALLTARPCPNRIATAALNAATEDALAFMAPSARAGRITLDASAIAPIESAVHGEAQTIRQIILNVLADALATAAPGATLSLHTQSAGNAITLSVHVSETLEMAQGAASDTFPQLLARTLCDLSRVGLELPEDAGAGIWQLTFTTATQRDLFQA